MGKVDFSKQGKVREDGKCRSRRSGRDDRGSRSRSAALGFCVNLTRSTQRGAEIFFNRQCVTLACPGRHLPPAHEAQQTDNDGLSDAQYSSETSQVEVLCVSVRPHQDRCRRSCWKRRKQTHQRCIVTEHHHRLPFITTQTPAPKSRLCVQFISTLFPPAGDGRAHCD